MLTVISKARGEEGRTEEQVLSTLRVSCLKHIFFSQVSIKPKERRKLIWYFYLASLIAGL